MKISKITTKYTYYDAANRCSHLVNDLSKVPANVVAYPMYLADDGVYYTVGDISYYKGYEMVERHNEIAVELHDENSMNEKPATWRYFKSEGAARRFVDSLSK